MNKLFQSIAFNLGFWVGLCLFIFINYLSYIISYNEYIDSRQGEITFSLGGYTAGFPFPFYQAIIGYPNYFDFIWVGLAADILIAIVFSFLIGLIFRFAWSKITAKKLR